MEGLMQPDHLRARTLLWAEEEIRVSRLPSKAAAVLEALLYRGELPRGDVASLVGTGESQARRVISALTDRGVLTSESTRCARVPHLSSCARLSMDAWIVSREDSLKRSSQDRNALDRCK